MTSVHEASLGRRLTASPVVNVLTTGTSSSLSSKVLMRQVVDFYDVVVMMPGMQCVLAISHSLQFHIRAHIRGEKCIRKLIC